MCICEGWCFREPENNFKIKIDNLHEKVSQIQGKQYGDRDKKEIEKR